MAAIPSTWSEHSLGVPATEADGDAYRALSGNAAKGIAVLTASYRGWDHAVTVSDYLSVTYDPPTMLVSLYSLSRMVEAVAGAGRWGLSLLASDQRAIAERFGEQGAPLDALLRQTPHVRRAADGPALIVGALCWFELRTVSTHEAATHTLVVGEVTAMGRAREYGAKPLVRFQSGFLR